MIIDFKSLAGHEHNDVWHLEKRSSKKITR